MRREAAPLRAGHLELPAKPSADRPPGAVHVPGKGCKRRVVTFTRPEGAALLSNALRHQAREEWAGNCLRGREARRQVTRSPLALASIDISSVPNSRDRYQQFAIGYCVDDSVIADANSVEVVAAKLDHTLGPDALKEFPQAQNHPILDRRRETLELPASRASQLDPIPGASRDRVA